MIKTLQDVKMGSMGCFCMRRTQKEIAKDNFLGRLVFVLQSGRCRDGHWTAGRRMPLDETEMEF